MSMDSKAVSLPPFFLDQLLNTNDLYFYSERLRFTGLAREFYIY